MDGAISLSNVALNIRTINCLIEEADLPVEFVDGYIQVLWRIQVFLPTRSYAALRAADLHWIVGQGYSLGRVHSGEKP